MSTVFMTGLIVALDEVSAAILGDVVAENKLF
jgi:hypothetical protein